MADLEAELPTGEGATVTTHPPPPNYGAATGTGDPKDPTKGVVPQEGDRFPAKTETVDLPWAIAWLINTLAFIGVSLWLAIDAWQHNPMFMDFRKHKKKGDDLLSTKSMILFFILVGCVAVVLAMGVYVFSSKFPKEFIWAGLGIQVVLCAISLIYGIMQNNLGMILFGAIVMALTIFTGYVLRQSIGLAAALIKGAAEAVEINWGIFVLLFGYICAKFVMIGVVVVWVAAVLSCFTPVKEMNDAKAAGGGFLAFWGLFSLLWMQSNGHNIIHCTCSGSVARLYYLGEERQGTSPTSESFQRAITSYLGASSFGAFLIAIVTFIRILVEKARDDAAREGNICACLVACICACCLRQIEYLLKIVNDFAMCYVAMYGNGFWTSGKMVFNLMKSSRLEPLFNNAALSWFSLTAFFVSFLLGGELIGLLTWAVFGEHYNLWRMISSTKKTENMQVIPMFLIAMFVCGMFTIGVITPLLSGARMLLVLFMESPAYFYKTKPQVYAEVRDRAAKMGLVDKAPAHFAY